TLEGGFAVQVADTRRERPQDVLYVLPRSHVQVRMPVRGIVLVAFPLVAREEIVGVFLQVLRDLQYATLLPCLGKLLHIVEVDPHQVDVPVAQHEAEEQGKAAGSDLVEGQQAVGFRYTLEEEHLRNQRKVGIVFQDALAQKKLPDSVHRSILDQPVNLVPVRFHYYRVQAAVIGWVESVLVPEAISRIHAY